MCGCALIHFVISYHLKLIHPRFLYYPSICLANSSVRDSTAPNVLDLRVRLG
jgi:hypothetical protein